MMTEWYSCYYWEGEGEGQWAGPGTYCSQSWDRNSPQTGCLQTGEPASFYLHQVRGREGEGRGLEGGRERSFQVVHHTLPPRLSQ